MKNSIVGSSEGWDNLKRKTKRKKPKHKVKACYAIARKNSLEWMGYSSYQGYLRSEEWRRIRSARLEKHPDCALCGVKATQVHHMSYDPITLVGGKPNRLVQLCGLCHEKIEITPDGEKRSLYQANIFLFQLAFSQDRWTKAYRWATRTLLKDKWFANIRRYLNR